MSESAGAGTTTSTATTTSTPAPQAQPSPAPSAYPERVKVKVEGRELEVPFQELLKDYQLREASNRRFQEASAMAKKAGPAMEAFEALQNGDIAKAKKLLPPAQFRKAMENYLIEELEFESLPEHQQDLIRERTKTSALEKQLNELNEGKNKEKAQRELAEAGAEVDDEISEALQKMGSKPTPYLVAAIIDEMLASIDGKGERLTGEQAYKRGKARLDSQTEAYLTDMSDQDFIAKLPPQRVEAIRKHLLSQIKTQTIQRPQAQQGQAPLQRADNKPKSIDEAFAEREAQLKSQRRKA